MALPDINAQYISELIETSPSGGDPYAEGDDNLRIIKGCLKTQFPSLNAAVTVPPADLNACADAASNFQNQLDDLRLVQGAAGFTSAQTNHRFVIPANQDWKAFINPDATEYSGGSFVSVNAATGTISIEAGVTPDWVRLHAILSLRPPINTIGITDWTITRAKFVRGSGPQSFGGSVYVTRIPNTANGQLTYAIECIDSNPAAVGEFYTLELNSDWAFEMDAEVWSMNIWAEVIGK